MSEDNGFKLFAAKGLCREVIMSLSELPGNTETCLALVSAMDAIDTAVRIDKEGF